MFQSSRDASASLSMGDVEMAAAGYSLNHAAQNFGYSLSVEEDARRQAQLMKKKEKMVIAIAAFTFLISFINIIIADSMIVVIAMLFGMIGSPAVMLRQRQLTSKESVRQVINGLRQSANKYHDTNQELKQSIVMLSSQAEKVKRMQQQLDDHIRNSGMTMDEFADSIKENSAVLEEMREILKAQSAQEILRIVLLSDRSKNSVLDRNEREILIVRLTVLNGVIFDEDLFRRKFTRDVTTSELICLIGGLYNDNDDSELGRIFKFDPLEIIRFNR